MPETTRRRRATPAGHADAAQAANAPVEQVEAPAGAHTRCGFIALIGAPNVGKSTLINALVGSKVAIVSHKVQTTRTLLRGIAIVGGSQLVFIDTPGIFAPKRRLDRAMVSNAWTGAHDADIVGLLIDARRGLDEEADAILARLNEVRRPKILIVKKIDLVDKSALLALAKATNARLAFAATFMISALTGDGVVDVRNWLAAHVPEGPWHYPEDQITDAPLRQLAAEVTREKLYLRLHQELPYQSTVETDSWQERKDGSVRIEQTIYVERESQRKIVLGKGGQTIKAIGADARREIVEMIEAPVHLFLFVKVRERWGDDPERYRSMGLDFPKE
jgi:GTP-binding protein Era